MSGCTAVRPVQAPVQFIPEKRPHVVYIVDKAGRVYTIVQPSVQGDSVVGSSARLDKRVGVALPGVRQVLAPQPAHARTVLLVVLLGAGAGGGIYAAIHAGTSNACLAPEPELVGAKPCEALGRE